MRNLSIALAIAMNLFDGSGSDAALVITVAYVVQIQAAAWYAKFADKIFVSKSSVQPVLSVVKGVKS